MKTLTAHEVIGRLYIEMDETSEELKGLLGPDNPNRVPMFRKNLETLKMIKKIRSMIQKDEYGQMEHDIEFCENFLKTKVVVSDE